MDDSINPASADDVGHRGQPAGLPQGPHFPTTSAAALTPLRLLLQPSGMTLELTRPDVLVGRHSECDVRLPLPDVSRKHCRFQFQGGCWEVVDQNSLNGVFVNEQRVERAVLRQGDRVTLGGFTFLVELPADAVGKAEAESLAQSLFQDRSGARTFWPPRRNAS